jgi:serine/threonine protein kinase
MIRPNDIITTTTGHRLLIIILIGRGTHSGRMVAVKIFHPDRCTPDALIRIKFLCALELYKTSSSLVAPRELIHSNGMMGYVMDLVEGVPLQAFLETTPLTFRQRLICLLKIVVALARLHAKGISHGDIRQANILVRLDNHVPVIHIIDIDNFSAAGVPGPTCLGDEMYLPPEQHASRKAGRPVPPDMGSDRYSIRIMAEEILTMRHPASGFRDPVERFEYAMYECWIHDPSRPPVPGVGGYPATILNSRVANLFRRGMHREPSRRPDLVEWSHELVEAMKEVFICPECHKPCLVDASRQTCPHCGSRYPDPCLALPNGRRISITQGCMQVGRAEIGAGNMVSAVHVVLRRTGPLLSLESFGMNGTFRKSGDSWIRVEDRTPVFISPGETLRFANVEVRVE